MGWMAQAKLENSDAQCIERFLSGETKAYEELVLRYQDRIYYLALRYLRQADEAQEVTQEIFVKVYQAIKTFRGEAKFSTWLFQVAVNHCKNRIKYLRRRHFYTRESLDQTADGESDQPQRQYAADTPDPTAAVQSGEIQRLVRQAIDELSEDHREAIILRDLQDLSYEEIAEITGQPVGTIKSRIHRARLELAAKLKPFVEAEGVP